MESDLHLQSLKTKFIVNMASEARDRSVGLVTTKSSVMLNSRNVHLEPSLISKCFKCFYGETKIK